jgi:hypothetical protein
MGHKKIQVHAKRTWDIKNTSACKLSRDLPTTGAIQIDFCFFTQTPLIKFFPGEHEQL